MGVNFGAAEQSAALFLFHARAGPLDISAGFHDGAAAAQDSIEADGNA